MKLISSEIDYINTHIILEVSPINFLRKLSDNIKLILLLHYDPNIKWALPKGVPPYRPLTEVENETMLSYYIKKRHFKHFFEGSNITSQKRQNLWIVVLETVAQKDAIMMCNIKDRVNIWPNITYDMVKQAYAENTKGWGIESALVSDVPVIKPKIKQPKINDDNIIPNVDTSNFAGLDPEDIKNILTPNNELEIIDDEIEDEKITTKKIKSRTKNVNNKKGKS